MIHQRLSACYFPTTVVLVDDNRQYLENIRYQLDDRRAVYRLYDQPKAALQFINQEYAPDYFTQRSVLRPEEEERDHRRIDVSIRPIRDEMYNVHRFEQLSVLVVDQEMPGLKGLDLCRQLQSSPIKKVLLTGEVDEQYAVDAFNQGWIDQFIHKKIQEDDAFSDVLNRTIAALQKRYFEDLSTLIMDSLTQNPEHHPLSCLGDPVFIRFFHALFQQHNLCEYYLTDANGSFMCLDFEGRPSWLVVKDETAMKGTQFDAEVADQKPTPSVMQSLVQREKILYLHDEQDWYLQPADWATHHRLYPAKQLTGGQQTYYYAYIDDPTAYPMTSPVLSFKDYLEQLG